MSVPRATADQIWKVKSWKDDDGAAPEASVDRLLLSELTAQGWT